MMERLLASASHGIAADSRNPEPALQSRDNLCGMKITR